MASKRQIKSREFIDDSDDPEDTGEQTRKKVKKTTAPAEDNTDDELIPVSGGCGRWVGSPRDTNIILSSDHYN
jgi:hypothetical protein